MTNDLGLCILKIGVPEEILETPQPAIESKSTDWTKIILATVIGLGLLLTSAYAGYLYGVQQAKPIEQPAPAPASTVPAATDPIANWKTYINEVVGISFKYPPSLYVHTLSDSKFSIALDERQIFQAPSGTNAPVFGVLVGLTGCTRPDIKQTYPCEKTPSDAVNGLSLRKYLIAESMQAGDLTISNREGKQVSGIVSDENDASIPIAGSFYKATYFSNNSTKDGEYLIVISLLETTKEKEQIYDQILSTFQFLD